MCPLNVDSSVGYIANNWSDDLAVLISEEWLILYGG
jgi:hypothetical protein